MISLRLVVDTNIGVSAALKPDGLQRTVVLLAITKPARLYISKAILMEYREVLSRPELRIRKGLQQQLLDLVRKRASKKTQDCSGGGRRNQKWSEILPKTRSRSHSVRTTPVLEPRTVPHDISNGENR